MSKNILLSSIAQLLLTLLPLSLSLYYLAQGPNSKSLSPISLINALILVIFYFFIFYNLAILNKKIRQISLDIKQDISTLVD